MKISIYQMQMFLSVAKTESISVSARNLHLSPSMLSKNISKTEEELGIILFIRDKGRLRLTPAGKVLREEFSRAIETVQLGIQKARMEQAVVEKPLRIGYPDSSNQKKVLPLSLFDYKRKNPSFDYNVEFYQFKDLPVEIKQGNLDIIFTTLFEEKSVKDLGMKYEVIIKYPLTIHVTPENPLSKKREVTIDDLAEMKLVLPSPLVVPNYYENVIVKLFKDKPFMPSISYYAHSSDAVVANIKSADEVFISDMNRKVEDFYNLIRIPIKGTESGVILAWMPGSRPLVDDFAKNTIEFWEENSIE